MFNNIEFANPFVLYFLAIIPAILFWYWKKNKSATPDVTYSTLSIFADFKPTLKERLRHLPIILRAISLTVFIIALARPQTFSTGENVYTEGIDVAVLLDISGSMLAEDFRPNRLDAAKIEIDKFVKGRTTDKIGLVVFARESFTQCPLTIDYSVLKRIIKRY